MSHDTDWVAPETPPDHWSQQPEYLAAERERAEFERRRPGTITPGTRTISTHELQMKACQVEWVDPNPKTEEQKAAELDRAERATLAEEAAVLGRIAKLKHQHDFYLDRIAEEMAADMIRKVNATLETVESAAKVELFD